MHSVFGKSLSFSHPNTTTTAFLTNMFQSLKKLDMQEIELAEIAYYTA